MLQLEPAQREALWTRLIESIECYIRQVGEAPVGPELDPVHLRTVLGAVDFNKPMEPLAALDFATENLWRHQTHTPHPRYYGLFNPAPTAMGIAADALVAAFNPQLAAWSHSPFAAEVENHLVRSIGARFGYDPSATDGVFASGGAEANLTAVLTALASKFPGFLANGVRSLPKQPVLYATAESHHSVLRAARLCGLGSDALRAVPVDQNLRMDTDALSTMITEDRASGFAPFLVTATAGTTNAGAIDPVPAVAEIASAENLWFHLDAAWGGAAALSPELNPILDGSANADSITFDAHKWLSVPMGAGMYLTRHTGILSETFATPTAYMPRDALGLDITDPHLHSIQWSRRFIGLKMLLSLLVAGWEGYAEAVNHMTQMGARLREQLTADGWLIQNSTPLPVVCFTDPAIEHQEAVARRVVSSGEAWISTTKIRNDVVLRACITNYRTGPDDIDALVGSLRRAKNQTRDSSYTADSE